MLADVLIGRMAYMLQRVQGVNKVEYESFQNGIWQRGLDPTWLCKYVKDKLRATFGKLQEDSQEGKVTFGTPPAPLAKDPFIDRVSRCMVK